MSGKGRKILKTSKPKKISYVAPRPSHSSTACLACALNYIESVFSISPQIENISISTLVKIIHSFSILSNAIQQHHQQNQSHFQHQITEPSDSNLFSDLLNIENTENGDNLGPPGPI